MDGVFPFVIENDRISSYYDESMSDALMLGKRAERFLSHYLRHHPNYNMLAENVQIIDQKETIGEFDFILNEANHGDIHLELACKFYLFDPNAASAEEMWCGPNKSDFFDLKVKKLKEHQFPMLRDARASPVLRQLDVDPSACKQAVLFQNFCFLPEGLSTDPNGVSDTNKAGIWLRQSAFESLTAGRELFFVPKKTNWLIDPIYNREWHTLESIKEVVNEQLSKKNSPMIWVLHPDGSTERWFVVWW